MNQTTQIDQLLRICNIQKSIKLLLTNKFERLIANKLTISKRYWYVQHDHVIHVSIGNRKFEKFKQLINQYFTNWQIEVIFSNSKVTHLYLIPNYSLTDYHIEY